MFSDKGITLLPKPAMKLYIDTEIINRTEIQNSFTV